MGMARRCFGGGVLEREVYEDRRVLTVEIPGSSLHRI